MIRKIIGRRLKIDISERLNTELERVAGAWGTDKEDVMRRAIVFAIKANRLMDAGFRIVAERESEEREIMP